MREMRELDSVLAKALEHVVTLFDLAGLRLGELEKRVKALEEAHGNTIIAQQ